MHARMMESKEVASSSKIGTVRKCFRNKQTKIDAKNSLINYKNILMHSLHSAFIFLTKSQYNQAEKFILQHIRNNKAGNIK